MFLDGATPLSAETGDPTWYLVWDVFGTWAGALGTITATGVAVGLGVRAIRDQNRQREEQKRLQAERVSLVLQIERGGNYLILRNDSTLPISRARVVSVGADRDELEVAAGHLEPGEVMEYHYGGVGGATVAVAEFVDAAGRTWVRIIDGSLEPIVRELNRSGLKVDYRRERDRETVSGISVRLKASGTMTRIELKAPLPRRRTRRPRPTPTRPPRNK